MTSRTARPLVRGRCANHLALVLATASLAELLREAEFGLLKRRLSPDRPLPDAINPLTTRFSIKLRPARAD